MADVRMRPGRSGSVSVAITLLGRDYQPMAPKEVTFALANPAAGIEPIERRAERVGEGEWEVRGLIVPVSGRWQVSVDVLVSDFEKMRLDGDVTIAP
jgi:copper transport protein